jgi:hypothetical protein
MLQWNACWPQSCMETRRPAATGRSAQPFNCAQTTLVNLIKIVRNSDLKGYLSPAEYNALGQPPLAHLSAEENKLLQNDLLRLFLGDEPSPGFRQLIRKAIGGPIQTFEELKKRVAQTPVPLYYLPEHWDKPAARFYIQSPTQAEFHQNAFDAPSEGQRALPRSPNGRGYSETCVQTSKDNLRSSSGWEDAVIVDVAEE